MPLATLTSALQDLLVHHGALAVFALMAVDAVLPVGGELIMLLAGALAAGALGATDREGLPEYLLLAIAGTLGYLTGAVGGWWAGRRGGRELVARHGRWLHLGPERFARAEAWFERRGTAAVFLGRLTPLVRSFISIPAGILDFPLRPYVLLTAAGSAIWCFAFAGAGWALGSRYDEVHHAFRYADVAAVLAAVGVVIWIVVRARRRPAAPGASA
jgi:membrane protein DedA with SNARE-associated domain